jgi:adenylate kinase family enzyme
MDNNKAKSFIFIGRSGCGKGTQAKLLMEKIEKNGQSFLHIESGALLREFAEDKSFCGQEVNKILSDGQLSPEFLVIGLWSKYILHNYVLGQYLIFDGAPRKQHEAMILDSVFDFVQCQKPIVLVLNVSQDWSRERLLARHRADDEASDIEHRLSWYETEVMPTLKYFKDELGYQVIEINGEQTIEQVHTEILNKLGWN